MFGLPEIVAEMIQLIDISEFKDAWLRYCAYCRAPRDVLDDLLGPEYKPPESPGSHAGILAYAAAMKGDSQLAAQVGEGFFSTGKNGEASLETQRIEGPDTLNSIDEATWVSTNDSAQWGLTAIRVSALVPEAISAD